MAEVEQLVEAPNAELSDEAPKEKITKEVTIGEETFTAVISDRKKRGQDILLPIATIQLETPTGADNKSDISTFVDFVRFVKAIGPMTFIHAVIRDMIKPSCNEASSDAMNKETGEFDFSKYVKALIDWYQAPDRRIGGPKVKEITEKMASLSVQLNKILSEWMQKPFSEWPENVQNEAIRVRTAITENGLLLEAKSNVGRKKKAAPVPVAA